VATKSTFWQLKYLKT